jgi:pentalenolactone synthase
MHATVRQVTSPASDPAWFVSEYETIKRLLTDPRLGRSHPDPKHASRYSEAVIFGQPMAASPNEQAEHAAMRKLLSPSFSARRLALLRPRVQALVDGLLDELGRKSPPVDAHEAISFPLPALVICELLGVPVEDREDFRRWSDDAADMTDGARSRAGWKALWQYMRALLERKRREPAEDVLSDLIAATAQHAQQADDIEEATADQIVPLAAGLLFAGHETTVAAIDKGIVLLLANLTQREALQHDPALVSQVIEEVLRLPLPVPVPDTGRASGLPRYANADIVLDDVTIHAGELVLLDLQGANLDPQRFAAPEAFDLARADNAHMTFGHGPHYCIGAPLARIELQAVFGTLFRRFPTLRLAAPTEQLRPRSHLLTGGLTALPVAW